MKYGFLIWPPSPPPASWAHRCDPSGGRKDTTLASAAAEEKLWKQIELIGLDGLFFDQWDCFIYEWYIPRIGGSLI